MIFKGQYIPKEVLDARKRRRRVFRSVEGQNELFNMLTDAGCFKTIKTIDEMYSRNLAIKWADELGLFDEQRIRDYIKWFMESDIDSMERREQECVENDTGMQFGNNDIPPYIQ